MLPSSMFGLFRGGRARLTVTNRFSARGALLVVVAAAMTATIAVAAAPADAGTSPVAISVSHAELGPPVSAGFVGIATELWDVEKEVGTNPAEPDVPFEQLVRNLAPHGGLTLRIGGDSTDWSWWPVTGMKQPPWVRWTMTPAWAAVTKRLVDDLHAHVIIGVNMEADNPQVATTEVDQIQSRVGGSVPITYELGNEPELYSHFTFYNQHGKAVLGRPKGYSYSDITSQWNQLAHTLAHIKLAGPGYSGLSALPYAGQFLGATRRLSLLTVHTYPLKSSRCGAGNLQENDLFQPQSLQTLASELGSWTSTAHHYGVPVRVDEMNSVTCGGSPSFSKTFGPGLWALNILPLYAEAGAAGVNFQTRPYTAQNLIQPHETATGWQMQVQPEYYGMLAFAQLTPPGSRLLRVSTTPDGLYTWAVRTPQGQTHVIVTNVTAHAAAVAVSTADAGGPATVEALRANSDALAASGGITLGGQTLSSTTGKLTGRRVTRTVHSSHGEYHLTVPAASAAIITLG